MNSKSVDSNPYPTTFIQADTASFKQVVQMLTGSAAAAGKHAVAPSSLPRNAVLPPKRPAFKLYERRSGLRNLKTISPLAPASRNSASGFSPRRRQQQQQQQQPEILSPSVLDFPALALSPVTPLNPDPFNRSPQPNSAAAVADEERAIAEKGFYLHPSPRSAEPPRLLPLFPVTSPRACPASAAATATGSFP
ncbi:VQ motif-containing protein 4 [Ananas comosus]|nr:VQ motif-containing protein 4 [Ananas comosus]